MFQSTTIQNKTKAQSAGMMQRLAAKSIMLQEHAASV
jgi:hypothetical protein